MNEFEKRNFDLRPFFIPAFSIRPESLGLNLQKECYTTPALARRWKKVDVAEFSPEMTEGALRHVFAPYCWFNEQLHIPPETMRKTVGLSAKYLKKLRSPAKEIELIHESIERLKAMQDPSSRLESLNAELQSAKEKRNYVTRDRSFEGQKLEKQYAHAVLKIEKEIEELESKLSNVSFAKSEIASIQRQFGWSSMDRSKLIDRLIAKAAQYQELYPFILTPEIVAESIASRLGVPPQVISHKPKEVRDILDLEEHLNQRVIGQRAAVSAIARAYTLFSSGIQPANKTIGNFLFFGPTGVGKTLLAKELAAKVSGTKNALLEVNLAQYTDRSAVRKLIGGEEEAGLLEKHLEKYPYGVVLLDEFEKAHPNVHESLLQVFDEGKITTNSGRVINCSDIFFILTSNLGAQEILTFSQNLPHGEETILQSADYQKHVYPSLEALLPPEFLNRLEIVPFLPLSRKALQQAIQVELKQVAEHIERTKNIQIEWDQTVVDYLTQHGFSADNGLRPMKKLVKEKILYPLALNLLTHHVKEGDGIRLQMLDGRCHSIRV